MQSVSLSTSTSDSTDPEESVVLAVGSDDVLDSVEAFDASVLVASPPDVPHAARTSANTNGDVLMGVMIRFMRPLSLANL
ncbi:MAG: hypothetical protein DRJ50_02970 [Actinobacteria bacterium]|nr:MAG: hypothetical protein DRJ50_02970 [Actinomycetota bacterium]